MELVGAPNAEPFPKEGTFQPKGMEAAGWHPTSGDAVALLVAYQQFRLNAMTVQGITQTGGRYGCSAGTFRGIYEQDFHILVQK